MKKYTYAALLQYDKDGISLSFPDIEEAYTFASTTEEVLKDAEEVLRLSLRSRINDGEDIPNPTELRDLKIEQNKFTTLVSVVLEN